jgi:oligoribonuclease
MFIGLDFETNGVNFDVLYPFEIGIILFDDDLNELDSYSSVVDVPDVYMNTMTSYVKDMHTKNGLLPDIASGKGVSLDKIRTQTKALFDKWKLIHEGITKAPLMGNSVHFDRSILREFFPELHAMVYHRNVDVSSFTEVMERWQPSKVPEKAMKHRAIDDVRESARLLKEIRTSCFT